MLYLFRSCAHILLFSLQSDSANNHPWQWHDRSRRHWLLPPVASTQAQRVSSSCSACTSRAVTLPCPPPVLCTLLVPPVAVAHCGPQEPQDKTVCHPLLARVAGLRVGSAIREIHGIPMHYGTKAPVSLSGEAQAPYHTGTAHSHETVPRHRLVHPRYGGRMGSHAHRFLLFPAEGQLHSGQSRCFQLAPAPLPW